MPFVRATAIGIASLLLFVSITNADIADDLLNALNAPGANTTQGTASAPTPSTQSAQNTTSSQTTAEQIAALQALVLSLKQQLTQLLAQKAASIASTPASIPSTATSNAGLSLSRNLSRGSRGEDVRQLQTFLISQNFLAADSATGFFGVLTEKAVQAWQSQNGIVSSGSPSTTGYGAVGPRTRTALMSARIASAGTSSGATTASVVQPAPKISSSGGGGTGGSTGSTAVLPSPTPPQTSISPTTQTTNVSNIDQVAPTNTNTQTVTTTASCSFNNQTVAHGASVSAYQTASVAYGQTCAQQTRTCTNGTLSGSYQHAACSASTAASCTFDGQTVVHNASVTAYESATVAANQSCVSQARTCSNGTLSGSYTYATCYASEQVQVPDVMVGFFSLLGVGWYRDYFREVHSLINTVFVHSVEPLTENLVYKIAEVSASGKKLILGSHLIFFTESGNERLRFALRSDYKQRFDQLWSTLAPYQKNIVGFYLIDEPFWGNLGPVTAMEDEQLRTAIDEVSTYVHQKAPGRLTMVTFAYPTVERGNFAQLIPSDVDLIGVNCYLAFGDVCSDSQIRKLVSTVISVAKPNQRLLVTADGWWQRVPTSADDVAMLARVRIWENILYPYFLQHKIGALMPFLYQFDGATYGIENFTNARIELVEYMRRLTTGLSDPLPGSSTMTPRGWLDAASCTSVTGWAQDQDVSGAPLALHIYIDAPAEPPWSGFAEKITANEYRGDLCGAIGSCNHGFSWNIPNHFRDGQAHTIWIYAIDPSNNGDNPSLSGTPKTFQCSQ